MYKQSSSRNHRSKGIKSKHILQICVLVAVCFWLLYQVKHSHEKRKEFESKDENSVLKLQSDSELQRFGRKDIPRVTEKATDVEKHEDDEDDKEDEEDKENKHEEDDMESEDTRFVEIEEERGGGDDEIDEHEPEKTDEEEGDEEKEREERESVTEESHMENEDTHKKGHPEEEEDEGFGKEGHTESQESDDVDKEDHGEREIKLDNHDHDHLHDVNRNNRTAQEELYRADDASSEVAQDVQSISQESQNATMGQTIGIYGKINFGHEHGTKTSENADELMKPDIQSRKDVNLNSTDSSATIKEPKNDKVNLTKADDSSLQNSTLPESPNNSTLVERFAGSLLSNGTKETLDFKFSQNGTIGIKQAIDGDNIENINTNKTKDDEPTKDSLISEGSENEKSEDTGKAGIDEKQAIDGDSIENINTNKIKDSLISEGSENEKPEDTGKVGIDEKSKSQSSDDRVIVDHDPIDASDIAIEEDSRADLDTLREIRSEVHGTEDEVAR